MTSRSLRPRLSTTAFQSTLPLMPETPVKPRPEAAAEHLDALLTAPDSKLFTTLSPSLLADLRRFEEPVRGQDASIDALEVLAAGLRHTKALSMRLQWEGNIWRLTVHPRESLCRCAHAPQRMWRDGVTVPEVLRVEPASSQDSHLRASAEHDGGVYPLHGLVWAVAMHGRRAALLPELTGRVCYRVSPSLELQGVQLSDVQRWVIDALREAAGTLRELAGVPNLGVQGAARLLNALYLSGGLIISRTHPAANRSSIDPRFRRAPA